MQGGGRATSRRKRKESCSIPSQQACASYMLPGTTCVTRECLSTPLRGWGKASINLTSQLETACSQNAQKRKAGVEIDTLNACATWQGLIRLRKQRQGNTSKNLFLFFRQMINAPGLFQTSVIVFCPCGIAFLIALQGRHSDPHQTLSRETNVTSWIIHVHFR